MLCTKNCDGSLTSFSRNLTFVWIQSIGLPTYCRVVTMTENVSRITDEMHLKYFYRYNKYFSNRLYYQWSLNTELSMWMWETLMRVFNLRNMSNMMKLRFLCKDYFKLFEWDWKYQKFCLTLINWLLELPVTCILGWVVVMVVQQREGWQVIKICAIEIWNKYNC